ncbi:MAG: hypothetical protein NXI12_05395 [Alphaproteobacteria bacterium]|nr:hypothetical protein [Alphaproteobacteria bacterium]
MSQTIGQDAAVAALGVDAWGLERLIALGELDAGGKPGSRVVDAEAVKACADARSRRRAAALTELAKIDAPHLGGDR